ncbi:daptide-type RiPP biosynthesis methyltransferase [Georgenia sp. SYP-B2076]|uniref:daptide-type RiPP biosynthesis methyltransferase n=1 Tax=Georgenia sp. SYP-B2076 TaxID=2495881 RepID=UPI000F8E3693|nr:daptide-type RiPP biosynthesis methyltransferase [Georgenia sp. SYP-B2076]
MSALPTAAPTHAFGSPLRLAPARPTTTHGIPGRAGHLVAALGDRADVHGPCDEVGADIHADLSDNEMHEIRAVLRTVLALEGPVLDLAAGLGRLTVPLLALRREVTALDISGEMLDRLVTRLHRAPEALLRRCSTVQADMSDFSLGREFAAIVLGGSSVALLDGAGRAGLYRSVCRHLAPGGRFLVSTIDHGAGLLPPEVGTELVTPSGRSYRAYDYWEPGAPTWTLTALPKDTGRGRVPVFTTTQRVLGGTQLQIELERAGLEVVSRTVVSQGRSRQPIVLIEASLPTYG